MTNTARQKYIGQNDWFIMDTGFIPRNAQYINHVEKVMATVEKKNLSSRNSLYSKFKSAEFSFIFLHFRDRRIEKPFPKSFISIQFDLYAHTYPDDTNGFHELAQ